MISLSLINILIRKYYYYLYLAEFGFGEVKEFAQGHAASQWESLETFWLQWLNS